MQNSTPLGTSKIKICHVANTDKAVKFLLLPQLRFLIENGYDVSVICSSGKFVSEIEKEGIKVKVIKMKRKISPFSDLVALVKIFLYFKKEKFGIVHVHNPKPSLLGQLAAKLARVPIIINTVHGLYFQQDSSKFKRSFYIFIEKIAALCSSLIFSQNKEDIETLIKEKVSDPKKIKYLGNGVDIGKFDCKRFSEEFISKKRKELNIPEGFKVVGIVARLVEEKGYLTLFEAFASVVKEFPKTVILAIGPKEPEKSDALDLQIVENYEVKNNVIFLGERNNLEELYPLMDIFVLPSYREGMPRSILEAMAEERPIITSNIRGCKEEIEDGISGILFPVGDSEKLAGSIIDLLENPAKAEEMGKNARIRAEKYFNENFIFGRIKEGYDLLLKEKHGN